MQACWVFAEIVTIHSLVLHSHHIAIECKFEQLNGKYSSGCLELEVLGISVSYNISHLEKRKTEVGTNWSQNKCKAISPC